MRKLVTEDAQTEDDGDDEGVGDDGERRDSETGGILVELAHRLAVGRLASNNDTARLDWLT